MERANTARRAMPRPGAEPESEDEAHLERVASPSRRIAVYGSLAPGCEHHDQLSRFPGIWCDGMVSGTLEDRGWGAGLGFPAIRLTPGPPSRPVQVFESPDLPSGWDGLDTFEGAEYRRVLVPVLLHDDRWVLANIYEAAG